MTYDPTQPYKNVDGVNINLTAQEIADIATQQAAWAAGLPQRQITSLEATVTQRRLREAVLGTDGGWLANVNSQITTLRSQINGKKT